MKSTISMSSDDEDVPLAFPHRFAPKKVYVAEMLRVFVYAHTC